MTICANTQYSQSGLWTVYVFTALRGPSALWHSWQTCSRNTRVCFPLDWPWILWQLRQVVFDPFTTTSRTLRYTCRSPAFKLGSSASAKFTWKSRNRLSPATNWLGYGSPVLPDFPPRRWHCAQIDVTTSAPSRRFFESSISLVSPVWFKSTAPWQT